MLPFLAAATATPIEKLQNVSGQFWIKVILGAFALALLIFLLKKVMAMNKIILAIIGFVILGIFGFNWIYQRNEPEFLTPFINKIAPFFPSQGAYDNKQTQDPGVPGAHKNAPATPAKPSPAPGTPATTPKKY